MAPVPAARTRRRNFLPRGPLRLLAAVLSGGLVGVVVRLGYDGLKLLLVFLLFQEVLLVLHGTIIANTDESAMNYELAY